MSCLCKRTKCGVTEVFFQVFTSRHLVENCRRCKEKKWLYRQVQQGQEKSFLSLNKLQSFGTLAQSTQPNNTEYLNLRKESSKNLKFSITEVALLNERN